MILFQKKPLINIDIGNRKFSSFIAKVDFTICILDMHMCSICVCIVFMYSNLLSWIYHLCICKEKIKSSYHDVGVSGCCTGTKAGGTELRTSTRLHRAQGGSPKNIRSRDPQCGIRTGSQVNPMVKLMTAIGLERVGRNFSSVLTFYCSFCVTALCKIITKQTRVTWISLQVSRQCPPGPMSTNSISCRIFGKINFVRKTLWEAVFCLTTCHLRVNKGPIGTKLALKPVMGAAGEESILLQNKILQ